MFRQLFQPKYLLIWLVATFATSFVLIWFFNFELLTYLYGVANLNFWEIIGVMLSSVGDVYSQPADLRGLLFIIFSLLMGANLTLLWYLRQAKTELETPKGFLGSSSGAALVGAGCVSCGGSIVAPLVSLVGGTATAGLSRGINVVAFLIAIGLVGYALYRTSGYVRQINKLQTIKKG